MSSIVAIKGFNDILPTQTPARGTSTFSIFNLMLMLINKFVCRWSSKPICLSVQLVMRPISSKINVHILRQRQSARVIDFASGGTDAVYVPCLSITLLRGANTARGGISAECFVMKNRKKVVIANSINLVWKLLVLATPDMDAGADFNDRTVMETYGRCR